MLNVVYTVLSIHLFCNSVLDVCILDTLILSSISFNNIFSFLPFISLCYTEYNLLQYISRFIIVLISWIYSVSYFVQLLFLSMTYLFFFKE